MEADASGTRSCFALLPDVTAEALSRAGGAVVDHAELAAGLAVLTAPMPSVQVVSALRTLLPEDADASVYPVDD